MTLRNAQNRRIVALFLLFTFLQSIVLPPMAHALTSGPTAPETTSFEPVDATDMVNLMTGDFTYTIPLLEVPGPEGGYPLALSYHAGIKPLEDASWVGLGWSLNPGAINRVVNGYPDDHKNVEREVEDFWEGGTTKTFSVGIGIGIAGGPSFGLSYSVSNDTYQGRSGDVGINVSFGLGGEKSPLSGSLSLSTSGRFGAGIGLDIMNKTTGEAQKTSISLGASFSTDFKGNSSYGASVSAGLTSLGVNMSSGGLRGSFSIVGGSSYQQNNKIGRISTSTSGFSIGGPIPLPGGFSINVSVASQTTRYWMHETDQVITNGVLNVNNDPVGNSNTGLITEDKSFDSYSLLDPEVGVAEQDNPDWLMGGSYPAFDGYQVTAQGLSGSIQPYIFENVFLHRKRVLNENDLPITNYFSTGDNTGEVNFRFVNDFSNSFTVTNPDLGWNWSGTQYSFSSSSLNYTTSTEGFNVAKKHLAGSRHVQYYSNKEIIDGNAVGFWDNNNLSNRSTLKGYNIENQIGGFSITNPSGVSYHFGLPVYTFEEEVFTKKIDNTSGNSWNKQVNNIPYSYTWLLTAITGPDFIDRNTLGEFDEEDWGYWVAFNYGKWTDDYKWRTPYSGVYLDINETVENYSYGKKQIYYLDAIQTRTHTALFVKDVRDDGKSVTSKIDGGSDPIESRYIVCQQGVPLQLGTYIEELPVSSMKLNKIVLIKNENLTQSLGVIKALKNEYAYSLDMPWLQADPVCDPSATFELNMPQNGNLVLDVHDFNEIESTIIDKIIKTIKLNADYSLCPETANSLDNSLLYTTNPVLEKKGKLALKSIEYFGNQGIIKSMPPLKFDYGEQVSNNYLFQINGSSQTIEIQTSTANETWEGDIVTFEKDGNQHHLLLSNFHYDSNTGEDVFDYTLLSESNLSPGSGSGLHKTKNPPFSNLKYDYWGYYKPDYIGGQVSPTYVTRIPSFISSKSINVWSLREIETSLGSKIKIDYSNKEYTGNVWQKYDRFNVNSIIKEPNGNLTLEFAEETDLKDLFKSGDIVALTLPYLYFPDLNQVDNLVERKDVYVYSVTESSITVSNSFLGDPNDQTFYDSGFLDFIRSGINYGNGVRVNSIIVEGQNTGRKTSYQYENGVISYNPASTEFIAENVPSALKEEYETIYKKDINTLIAWSRFIPGPSVMYGKVSLTESINGIPIGGKKEYEFRLPQKEMVDIAYSEPEYLSGSQNAFVEAIKRTVTVKNKTGQIGNLLKAKTYNLQNQMLSETVYDYADDESGENESDYNIHNNQGIVQQAFHEIRRKTEGGAFNIEKNRAVVSLLKDYPSILKSTTNTAGGITTTTYNRAYDFYTGEPTVIESENTHGERFRSESIAAYHKYPEMGLKTANPANKHMLTQNAFSQTTKIDENGVFKGLLSANITTWSDDATYREAQPASGILPPTYRDDPTTNGNIWRKHKTYIFKGDADTRPDGTFPHQFNPQTQAFNWTNGTPTSSEWQKTSEITRYDHYSKPLEAKDINSHYGATKMGYNQTLPIATCSNARFTEMYYSGAEDALAGTNWFGGEVANVNAEQSSDFAHTGDYSLKLTKKTLSSTKYGFSILSQMEEGIQRGKKYHAQVWVKDNGDLANAKLYFYYIDENGNNLSGLGGTNVTGNNYTIKAGDWVLLDLDIDIDPNVPTGAYLSVNTFNNSSTADAYFDDFRFFPLNGTMTSYVYDPDTDALRFILNAENMYTEYEYDNAGRLHKVYQETTENPTGKRLLTEHGIHYARPTN